MTISHTRKGRSVLATRFVEFAIVLAFLTGCTENPETTKEKAIAMESGVGLEMAWIPAGDFAMGSPESEPGRNADEPQHQVSLTNGYWMGKTEVTIGQWRDVMGESIREHLAKVISDETFYGFDGEKRRIRDFMNMSSNGDIGRYLANEEDDVPMYFANWNDAMAFCAALTRREGEAGRLPVGYEFTLPTEAQWEYACRAGTTTETFSKVIQDVAWYGENSSEGYAGKGIGPSFAGPRKVGQKQANEWGLYDMTGNLWEWCRDWYGPYPSGNVADPKGPESGTHRVNRGGSFGSDATAERSANRAKNPPAEASGWRGFRIVLSKSNFN